MSRHLAPRRGNSRKLKYPLGYTIARKFLLHNTQQLLLHNTQHTPIFEVHPSFQHPGTYIVNLIHTHPKRCTLSGT